MQNIYEVFFGSTVDAKFINTILSDNNIEGIIKSLESNANENANWINQDSKAEVSVSVLADNFEKAEKLVREYKNSRAKE